jgi:hypothetical protein
MGQSQSQSQSDNQPVLVNRAPTPEPKDPVEAQRVREEREKGVAEVGGMFFFFFVGGAGKRGLFCFLRRASSCLTLSSIIWDVYP